MSEQLERTKFFNIFKWHSISPVYSSVDSNDKEVFRDSSERNSSEVTLLSESQKRYGNTSTDPKRRKWAVLFLTALFIVAVTFIATIAALSSYLHRHHSAANSNHYTYATKVTTPSKSNDKPHPCGTSAAEARARNCTFNQLTWAWIPPSCPSYSEPEFVSAESKPWVYWQDLEQTMQVKGSSWEEMLDGERAVFGEKREHLTHCIFMSLSLAQLLHSGGAYWEKLVDYEHHEHCAKMLLAEIRKGNGVSRPRRMQKRDEEMEEWGDGGWESLQTFVGGASFDQDCEGRRVHVAGMDMTAMNQGGGYRRRV